MLFTLTLNGHQYRVKISRTLTGIIVVETQGLGSPHCSLPFLLQDIPGHADTPPSIPRGPRLNVAEHIALEYAVRRAFFHWASRWRIDLSMLPVHTLTDFPTRRLGSTTRNATL
ncbi:hypothetical protein B0H16DRAFT_1723596 [Mycena metata]|uniref:Uncharacterized protein n=1 Tax=Mycena metata TaxID=1033252 RepID=A0AAD7IXX2_9AGAR|nr:hypothetical protein B0H16DRAFT_1723596 [Mycena metata]